MARWSTPIAALAEKAKLDVETVAKKATADLFTAVVLKSPVDTGRFRANWNVSYGGADYSTTLSTDKGRGLQEAQKALTLDVGGVVYLSNGLPYARRLEHGWSKQAPIGMVRLSVLEFKRYLLRALHQ